MRQNTISTIWSALIILTLAVTFSFATPGYINYQGHLTDMDGAPMNGTVSITFSIYSDVEGGFARWTEIHPEVEVAGGHFAVILGDIKPFPSGLFDYTELYLGVAVGDDHEMSPRGILSVGNSRVEPGGGYSGLDDLTCPDSIWCTIPRDIVDVTQHGSGGVFYGHITADSAANSDTVIYARTEGTGPCGYFQIANASNMASTVLATSNGVGAVIKGLSTGIGNAGRFEISNSGNGSSAVLGQTNGSGAGVFGYHYGNGIAGKFQIYNVNNWHSAIYATTNGTGSAADLNCTNSENNAAALKVTNEGDSPVAHFLANNTSTTDPALWIQNYGEGDGIDCQLINGDGIAGKFANYGGANSTNPALYGYTNGYGESVKGVNAGAGNAGFFSVTNSMNPEPSLYVETNGTGPAFRAISTSDDSIAAHIAITNANSAWPSLYVTNDGPGAGVYSLKETTGSAGIFQMSNDTTTTSCVHIQSNGDGFGLCSYTDGDGGAGKFQIGNGSSSANALYGCTGGSGSAIFGYNHGTGKAGHFVINNANNNASTALLTTTNGTGPAFRAISTSDDSIAAHIAITNQYSIWPSLAVEQAGPGIGIYSLKETTGIAGYFHMYNDTTTTPCLFIESNGDGEGVRSYMTGDGIAGSFKIQNVSNSEYALYASTNGTGGAGYFDGDVAVTGDITVDGNADIGSFTMASGASNGYVLTSDGSGNGTWQSIDGRFGDSGTNSSYVHLLEVIKELQKKNSELEARIAALETATR